jgi:hypothetical protein
MPFDADHLYNLLPSLYRIRDGEQGGPLKALVAVMATEVAAVIEEDLAQLYDDQFIETCAEWVVPYIGDLIGYRSLYGVAPRISSPRAEVANTIAFRRRRGTASMLEQLAHDVTGWSSRVVEFFDLLATTQHMQHIRSGNHGIASLRRPAELERIGTPFDPVAHTLDVRRLASGRGRYNIPNIGIFLWRLGAHGFTDVPLLAVAGDPLRYRFDPLGVDRPLVSNPLTEDEITHLAERANVPMPLTALELRDNLPLYWGHSLAVSIDDPAAVPPAEPRKTIPAGEVAVCNLSDDPANPGAWVHMPAAGDPVAIDPERGRIAFPAGPPPTGVRGSFHTAFSAEIGGGEYERAATFDEKLASDPLTPMVAVPDDQATIAAALAALGAASGIVEVTGNGRYDLPSVTLAPGQRVEIRAQNGRRPLLAPTAEPALGGGAEAELLLNGFLVVNHPLRVAGSLRRLTVRHCTLVPGLGLTVAGEPEHPGEPSIRLEPDETSDGCALEIAESITGPLRFPRFAKKAAPSETPGLRCELVVRESIVDAGGRTPRAERFPVLTSGELTAFPGMFQPTFRMLVTIGGDGPHPIQLDSPPTDLAGAATLLQAAIRTAAPGPAFAAARVLVGDNRLIVVAALPDRVAIEREGLNLAASFLKLDPANSRQTTALASAPLTTPGSLTAAAPALTLALGVTPTDVAGLPQNYADLTALAAALQTAIRLASAEPAYAGATIGVIDDRLLIVPGAEGATAVFGASAGDPTSLRELGLSTAPAIGAGGDGVASGPVATIDRATIIGPIYALELPSASESILLGQVLVVQRQTGCVRFSYLPPGSRTPRRYRCQPVDGASSLAIRPSFTSLRYGDSAYGQLARDCPVEIARGAEDEAEMGAFHDLFQPQRETNLRVRLEEYLRLGLEAGIIFAT